MSDELQYLALMAACVAITLPLEAFIGARVYRQPKRLVMSMAPVVAVFVVWDLFGIARDHWTFNERYVTGIELPGNLPIEEMTFFIVIPICGLLTYEAVGKILRIKAGTTDPTPPSPLERIWEKVSA